MTRGRKKHGLFLMEGPHLLEVLLDAAVLPEEVYYQPELLQHTARGRTLLQRLLHVPELTSSRLIEVSQRVMDAISEVQVAQGVVSVLPQGVFAPATLMARRSNGPRPALLVLDDLADPGNLGTILRTALAADVQSVLLTSNCVDYYSPKVIRAAAGAHIALPVETALAWNAIAERVALHCAQTPRVLLAEAGSRERYYEQDLTRPFALIIGNEAHGLSSQARALASRALSIPLANQVESLNAAMATGILLFEAVRQLRFA